MGAVVQALLAGLWNVLPVPLWMATAMGAGLGAGHGLVRAVSPRLADRIVREAAALGPVLLCLALMFFYDTQIFGFDWIRAILWALAALVLIRVAACIFRVIQRWLEEGHLRRVTCTVLGVALLVCVPFLVRFAGW